MPQPYTGVAYTMCWAFFLERSFFRLRMIRRGSLAVHSHAAVFVLPLVCSLENAGIYFCQASPVCGHGLNLLAMCTDIAIKNMFSLSRVL